jgi:hypothetical protein
LVRQLPHLLSEGVFYRNHKEEMRAQQIVIWHWDEDGGEAVVSMEMDATPTYPSGTNLHDWAEYYAERGWPVIPLHSTSGKLCTCQNGGDCKSPGKHPRLEHGLKEASTSVEQVERWWKRWPDANIGLCTGFAFDVIDVDGDKGRESIKEIEAVKGPLPYGLGAATGGGGCHLLFLPVGCGNRASFLPKVDYRGKGGYIVAPPSNHESGLYYEWMGLDHLEIPLLELPEWMRLIVDPPHVDRRSAIPTQFRVFPAKGVSDYGKKALVAELKELARTQEGMRNHQLNISAFNLYQLVAGGELTEEVVEGPLERTAEELGLSPHEIHNTMMSAKRAGLDTPRNAPLPPTVKEMPIEERIKKFAESGSGWWKESSG